MDLPITSSNAVNLQWDTGITNRANSRQGAKTKIRGRSYDSGKTKKFRSKLFSCLNNS